MSEMTPQIYEWVDEARKVYIKNPGRVLDVGSLDVNGTVRPIFSDATEYVGVDMQAGQGVDIAMNSHELPKQFYKQFFDTIVCLETLEHDDMFWVTIDAMHSLLKKGGHLIITTPTFKFPEHPHPKDYYRFGRDVYYDIFFKGFTIERLDFIKDYMDNPGICAIGTKL